jgi:polysaccharide pyruvyl transferase WcaK-like protein
MEKYGNTKRFFVLDTDNLNYCQIRHIISNCKMFVGGRTHAVISAYSTCVPAIALGYSIKSRGIAKDLGLSENLVVDSKHIHHEGYLLDAFNYMYENEASIRKHLQEMMPEYRQRTYGIREFVNKM